MKKALLLLNASAGAGTVEQISYKVIEALSLGGYEVTAYPILPKKGIVSEKIVADHGTEYDLIVCSGGDGSLNHAMTALLEEGIHVPLGYIPCGSTNDFAKSLGISPEVEKACAAITDGIAFDFDVGMFNERYFNYVAAFGAFTEVSYNTKQEHKNIFGHAAYVINGAFNLSQNLSKRCHMIVSHDGETFEDDFIYGGVCNSTSVGGFKAPYAETVDLSDGLFEVLLIRAPENFIEMQQTFSALIGQESLLDNPYITYFKSNAVHFENPDSIPWTLDGEYGGAPEGIDIEVRPKALSIMIPKPEDHSN